VLTVKTAFIAHEEDIQSQKGSWLKQCYQEGSAELQCKLMLPFEKKYRLQQEGVVASA
jgi:hypothetical protein